MRRTPLLTTVVLAPTLTLGAACSRSSPPPPPPTAADSAAPATNAAVAVPPPDASVDYPTVTVSFAGLTTRTPTDWVSEPPKNMMRAANWILPGRDGGGEAQLVVYQGIGGGVDWNITRWMNQFDGGPYPSDPERQTFAVDGMPVTLVEMSGAYQRTDAPAHEPNQTLIAAIVEGPDGDLQIMLSGPSETVAAYRDPFLAFLGGIHQEG